MSKAFTSDSDETSDPPEGPALPLGVRNYMTLSGAARLRGEVERLARERRLVESGVEGKDRAQKIDRQLRYWLARLDALEPVDPLTQPKDVVLFGATVTLSEKDQKPQVWRIVGLDESDLNKGWISWMSPLASALLEKRCGETVSFLGRNLTIIQIAYTA